MADTSVDSNGDAGKVLRELIDKAGALTALLVTKDGIAVAQAGACSYLNVTSMAALVAGMFAATREVAKMVGEDQFSILLQQGENRHIHISLILGSTMMVVIFEDYQRIGLVRHEARRTAEKLASILTAESTCPPCSDTIATPQFKEYALNLIDRIFEVK